MSFEAGNFKTLSNQLQSIVTAFLEDQELCQLVAVSATPLSDPYSLLNTRIYYDYYRPPTDTELIQISVFFSDFKMDNSNPYFKYGKLNINVTYHRNLVNKNPIDSTLLHYAIMHRIDTILNRNSVSGSVSKDWFERATYYPVNDVYNSFTLTYTNWNL